MIRMKNSRLGRSWSDCESECSGQEWLPAWCQLSYVQRRIHLLCQRVPSCKGRLTKTKSYKCGNCRANLTRLHQSWTDRTVEVAMILKMKWTNSCITSWLNRPPLLAQ